jgi:tripartite ATP-independent transporter DctP family solute receptor
MKAFGLAAAGLLATTLLGSLAAQADTRVLRLGHPEAPTHPHQVAAEKFKELVEAGSNGALTIEIYGQNQLGGQKEIVQGLRTGSLELGIASAGFLASNFPRTQVLDLPFLFSDPDVAAKLLDGEIGAALNADLEAAGIKGLGWGWGGYRNLETVSTPVRTPADLAGLRIRIQDSPLFASMFKAADAIPVPVAWAETYTALQQGLIDGLEVPLVSIHANKMYEVTKYVSLTQHSYNSQPIMMSLQVFQSLTPEQQALVLDAGQQAAQAMRAVVAERETKTREDLKAAGMEFVEVDLAAFQATMAPVYEEFRLIVGDALLDLAIAATKAN